MGASGIGDNNATLAKDMEAHMWVIDAMITQEWWYYHAEIVHSNYPPYEHHDVIRERCRWQFCLKKIAFLNLLILSVLLAGCNKDECAETQPEPVAPYELRLDPPWARFESDLFERALEEGDMSVFSKTILISGGTAPYRIEPAKEIYSSKQGGKEISIKMTELLKVSTECIPGQQDRIIVELLSPEILLVFPPEFTIYDKNGGCAKFTVEDRDIIWGV